MGTISEIRIAKEQASLPDNLGEPLVGQNSNPVIFGKGTDLSTEKSMSAAYSNIARLVTKNEKGATGIVKNFNKDITLSDALDKLSNANDYNDAMKNIVLESVNSASTDNKKIAVLEKGLAFLETEKQLSKCVHSGKMDIAKARELLTKCLNSGCTKDFSLGKLNQINERLAKLSENKSSNDSVSTIQANIPQKDNANNDKIFDAEGLLKICLKTSSAGSTAENRTTPYPLAAGDAQYAVMTEFIDEDAAIAVQEEVVDVQYAVMTEFIDEDTAIAMQEEAVDVPQKDIIKTGPINIKEPYELEPKFATNNDNEGAISEGTNQQGLEQQLSVLIQPFINNNNTQDPVDNASKNFELLNDLLKENPELRNNPDYTNAVKDLDTQVANKLLKNIFSKNEKERKMAFEDLENLAQKNPLVQHTPSYGLAMLRHDQKKITKDLKYNSWKEAYPEVNAQLLDRVCLEGMEFQGGKGIPLTLHKMQLLKDANKGETDDQNFKTRPMYGLYLFKKGETEKFKTWATTQTEDGKLVDTDPFTELKNRLCLEGTSYQDGNGISLSADDIVKLGEFNAGIQGTPVHLLALFKANKKEEYNSWAIYKDEQTGQESESTPFQGLIDKIYLEGTSHYTGKGICLSVADFVTLGDFDPRIQKTPACKLANIINNHKSELTKGDELQTLRARAHVEGTDPIPEGKDISVPSDVYMQINLLTYDEAKELVGAINTTEKSLGEGSFGVVHKVTGKDGKTYAVKIAKNSDSEEAFKQEKQANEYLFSNLSEDERKYFVSYYGGFEIDGKYVFITEFIDKPEEGKSASFNAYIKDGHKDTTTIIKLLQQGLERLAIEHRIGLLNRDIKPENMMVARDDNGNLQLKGMDYGTACTYSEIGDPKERGLGSPTYMSPEILKKESYSFSTDVYSMGISLLEGFFGEVFSKGEFKFPWKIAEFVSEGGVSEALKNGNFDDLKKNGVITQDSLKSNLGDDADKKIGFLAKLVADCTAFNPQERITAEQAAYLLQQFNEGNFSDYTIAKQEAIKNHPKAIPDVIINMIKSEDPETKQKGIDAVKLLILNDPSYIETENFKNLDKTFLDDLKKSDEYGCALLKLNKQDAVKNWIKNQNSKQIPKPIVDMINETISYKVVNSVSSNGVLLLEQLITIAPEFEDTESFKNLDQDRINTIKASKDYKSALERLSKKDETTAQEIIINTILKTITNNAYTTERSSKERREMISNALNNINLTNIDLTELLENEKCSRGVKVALLQLNNLSINQKIQILDFAKEKADKGNTTNEIIAYCKEHKNLQEIKTFAENYYEHSKLIKQYRNPDFFIGLFMSNSDFVENLQKIQKPQELPLEVVKVFLSPTTFTEEEKNKIKARVENLKISYMGLPEEVQKLDIISAWIRGDKENLQKLFNENNTPEIKDLFEQLKGIYNEQDQKTTKPIDAQALDQAGESVQTPEDHGEGGNEPVEKQDGENEPYAGIDGLQQLFEDGKPATAPETLRENDQGMVDELATVTSPEVPRNDAVSQVQLNQPQRDAFPLIYPISLIKAKKLEDYKAWKEQKPELAPRLANQIFLKGIKEEGKGFEVDADTLIELGKIDENIANTTAYGFALAINDINNKSENFKTWSESHQDVANIMKQPITGYLNKLKSLPDNQQYLDPENNFMTNPDFIKKIAPDYDVGWLEKALQEKENNTHI